MNNRKEAAGLNIEKAYDQKRKSWFSLLRLRRQAQGGEASETGDTEEGVWLRIREICDPGSFKEMFQKVNSPDPLRFPGYENKKKHVQEALRQPDACIAGTALIHRRKVAIGFLDGRFLMGSMGYAVGEKITLLAEYAMKKKLPLILFSASGGARMQEGMFSLVQMAKTSAAVEAFKRNGGLYISCLTDPTTGGVSASFASLGDIIMAEPGALICFAGPRVIEQTIGEKLPEGFQRAEFLLEHGMIDRIVERSKWRRVLNHILYLHGIEKQATKQTI